MNAINIVTQDFRNIAFVLKRNSIKSVSL